MHPRILFLLIWRRTSKSLFKGAKEGWSGAPGGSYNRYNGFEISIIVNAKKTTHVVLDTSPFVTSHTMMNVLDCTKPSFDHGFDGGCAATRGVDKQLVCSGRSQALFSSSVSASSVWQYWVAFKTHEGV